VPARGTGKTHPLSLPHHLPIIDAITCRCIAVSEFRRYAEIREKTYPDPSWEVQADV